MDWTVDDCLSQLARVGIPLILVAMIILLWNLYNTGSRDYRCTCPLPPGHFGLPFVGETLQLLLQGSKFLDNKYKRFGPIYKTHLFGAPTIRIIGSEYVSLVLHGEHRLVVTRWPNTVHALLGEGLALQADPVLHSNRKKALLKLFGHKRLTGYEPLMCEVIDTYINSWLSRGTVRMDTELPKLTFDITCRCLLGLTMISQEVDDFLELFRVFFQGIFAANINLPGTAYYRALRAKDSLVHKIMKMLDHTEGSSETILFYLAQLKPEVGMTSSEVAEMCLELLFAGHHTTASAAMSMVRHLAQNGTIVGKLKSLLLNESVGHSVKNTSVEGDIYMRQIVKEVLRIAPPIGAGYRQVVQTFVVAGFQVPRGWTVAYSIRESHENSTLFSDPERFDPSRWNEHENDKINDFLAFGGGKRSCVGRYFAQIVLKLFLKKLMTHCCMELLDKTVEWNDFPTPHPRSAMIMHITPAIHADS